MRVIYADILLAINLAVDYLLLFATARLSGAEFIRIKGFLGAALGAVYSLAVLFDFSGMLFAATKFVFSALMVFITFGKRKTVEFLRLLIIFYICGFIFSGFMMLINSFLKNDTFFSKGGIVYFEFSAMEVVLSVSAAFAVTEILRRLFRHGEPEGTCMVKIYFEGSSTVLKGFVDTGNNLSEPFSGSPVAIANADSICRILPDSMKTDILENSVSTDKRIKPVFCTTVSGTVLMNVFRPDEFIMEKDSVKFKAEDILVAGSHNVPENTVILGKNIIFSEKKRSFSEVDE